MRTLRHLRLVQIFGRLWFRFYRPRITQGEIPEEREKKYAWLETAKRSPSMTGPLTFYFLNEEHELKSKADWDDPAISKLWRYNLHYFDDLNAINALERQEWHHSYIERWLIDNPPPIGTGWEPYPTSLRIVNWIKWGLGGNQLSPEVVSSLAIQLRWLRRRLESHLLGNHLVANAKALVFGGMFFEGNEAVEWLKKGEYLLNRELREQILADGGHFERSPMYHAILLEDMLDIVNLYRTYGKTVPAHWNNTIKLMRYWLAGMCHPDEEISFFNDAAIGISLPPADIEEYARRLGYEVLTRPADVITHFRDSGYAHVSYGKVAAFLDLAPIGPDYLPGHGHADTLSFELSLGKQRIFVNSGTSEYGLGPERMRQRGTAAHNTVVVDGENSSEVWGGFRVGRRARVIGTDIEKQNPGSIRIQGRHDGYSYLKGAPFHQRSWEFNQHSIVIVDEITGEINHQVEVVFHIHPDCHVVRGPNGNITITDSQNLVLCSLSFEGSGEQTVLPSTYHPMFGMAIANQKVVWEWEGCLPVQLKTTISWILE